jgi:hypothetical protein
MCYYQYEKSRSAGWSQERLSKRVNALDLRAYCNGGCVWMMFELLIGGTKELELLIAPKTNFQ